MEFGVDRNISKTQELVDSEGSWAISYGDMVTLLLAFFVLFFTVNPNEERKELLQETLLLELSETSTITRKISSADLSQPKTTSSSDIAVGVAVKEEATNIDEKILKSWSGKVYKSGQRIIVDFPNTSFFHLGKEDVNNDGMKALKEFVEVYMPYAGQYTLGIRAYTDTRKVMNGRRFRDNLELSALRSISTMRILSTLGIPMDKMKLGGYGELQLTIEELNRLATETGAKDPMSFARKIVLVIEPEVEAKKGSS